MRWTWRRREVTSDHGIEHIQDGVIHMKDVSELPPHTEKQIRRFFMDYKSFEGKEVVVEEFMGREVAIRIVEEAIVLYGRTFGDRSTE